MTTNGNSPAFPTELDPGLTKREWVAGMALGGLMAFPGLLKGKVNRTTEDIADGAVEVADAILSQLEKQDQP